MLNRSWTWTQRAAPFALAAALALLATVRWGDLVVEVADRWDGESTSRREDVAAYYAGGVLVEQGRADALYEPETVAETERDLLGRTAGRHDGLAFMNPPFVAGVFAPLARWPYGQVQALWFAVNALAVFASLALLQRELRGLVPGWRLAFGLAALASFSVFWSLLYGQSSALILLSWTLCYRLLKGGREAGAGLALAVSLIKPQMAVLPALYLLATGRRRALLAFAASAAVLVAASVMVAGPEVTFVSYPHLLLESTGWQDQYGVDRTHMFGWSGFFERVGPDGSSLAGVLLTGLASALTLLVAAYVFRRRRPLDDSSRSVLAVAIATILISPHFHAQDLQILIVPAALLAGRRDALAVPALAFLLLPLYTVVFYVAPPALALSLAFIAMRTASTVPPHEAGPATALLKPNVLPAVP